MKVRILTRAEVAALYDPGARWRRVEDLAVIAQDPECAGALALAAPNLRATALAAIDRADAAETALAAANARIEGLTWESYQREAARTGGRDLLPENRDKGLNCAAMGLAGEAGEVCDLVKKVQHHRQPLDETKLRKELGDVLWYLAHACNVMGWRLDAGAFATWEARSPTGPVAWSELARLVEGVRRG